MIFQNFFTDIIRCESGSLYEKGEREDAGGGRLFYKKDPKKDKRFINYRELTHFIEGSEG